MQKRVRAIIIENGKLLTIKRVKEKEIYWVLPGGGIEDGESDIEALVRECHEELGVNVEVGEFVSEDDFYWKGELEKIYFYKCEILSGEVGTGEGPEFQENSHYEGSFHVQWLNISELENYDLRPENIKKLLIKDN